MPQANTAGRGEDLSQPLLEGADHLPKVGGEERVSSPNLVEALEPPQNEVVPLGTDAPAQPGSGARLRSEGATTGSPMRISEAGVKVTNAVIANSKIFLCEGHLASHTRPRMAYHQ